jgi:hypothetical protein
MNINNINGPCAGPDLRNSLRDVRTTAIELRGHLGALERDWVLGCLAAQRGVEVARWLDEDSCRLVIDHDADVLTGTELVNFLYTCGLPTRSVRRADG